MADVLGAEGTADEFTADEGVDWADDAPSTDDTDAEDTSLPEADASDEPTYAESDTEASEPEAPASEERTWEVVVNGEKVTVSEEELTKGYQRQADYTRKTQELARERDAIGRLMTALENDFDGTVDKLRAQLYPETARPQDTQPQDDVELDPLEARIRQVESQLTERQRAERLAAIDAEINAIKEQDPDLDEAELLQFAYDNQIRDLRLAHEVLHNRRTASRAVEARRKAEAEREAKVQAKRQAPRIQGGQKAAQGAVKDTPKIRSLDEILEAAFEKFS